MVEFLQLCKDIPETRVPHFYIVLQLDPFCTAWAQD